MIPKFMERFLKEVLPERTWRNRLVRENGLCFMEFGPMDIDRLNRLGRWQGLIAENISTGEEEARDVVLQLLIDDGVASRGHRKNLFNPGLHQAGAGTAPHRDYRVVTVIDYADGFVENH